MFSRSHQLECFFSSVPAIASYLRAAPSATHAQIPFHAPLVMLGRLRIKRHPGYYCERDP